MTDNKHQKQKCSFSESFLIVASVFLLILLLHNSSIAGSAVAQALKICSTMLIPSLFPLMIASEIAVECGAIEKITAPLNKIVSRILGIKKEAVSPYFLGAIGGYTTAVCGALALYRDKKISKDDCERVIALSSLPSLSFLIGFVGMGVFDSKAIGWSLWLITIVSSLILGIFIPQTKCKDSIINDSKNAVSHNKTTSFTSKILVNAISHSSSAMLLICACVVFFSSLIATLKYPLTYLQIPEEIQKIILGSLEITNGASSSKALFPMHMRTTVCSFFIGWSGLSVHFQILSFCEGYDLSFKKYFVFKIAQGFICALLAYIFL